MRWLWVSLAAVVLAGVAALWWPDRISQAPDRVDPAASPGSGSSQPPELPAMGTVPETAVQTAPTPKSAAASPPADAVAATAQAPFQPQRLPDGTLRLDHRFSLSGSGSEQDPFRLTWPLLASAADSVDAAANHLTPPPHIQFLDGQWVQISAYLAPPLWGERTTELLVMKNRWDGCCIGLPPTPFDCVEATLATPVTLGARHSISYGTVRGRLTVQPFTAGMFLLGLYRLEQAQLEDVKAR